MEDIIHPTVEKSKEEKGINPTPVIFPCLNHAGTGFERESDFK
jgi:hypothetical protein